MATIVDYASLTQAIADFTHRSDLTAGSTPYSDYLIQSALEQVQNDIFDANFGNGISLMENGYSQTIDETSGQAPVPTDWLAPKLMTVSDGDSDQFTLIFKSAAWLYDNYPIRQPEGLPAYIARDRTTTITAPGYLTFTASQGQQTFSIAAMPSGSALVFASLGGAMLNPEIDYSVTGTVLTLTNGASSGQTLYVAYALGAAAAPYLTFTATSGQTSFSLANAPSGALLLFVSLDGSTLEPVVDYNVAGTTLTLTTGAVAGQVLYAQYYSGAGASPYLTFTATQGQTQFSLAAAPTGSALILVVGDNGSALVPTIDYSTSGTTLTLTEPANQGDTLYVQFLSGSGGSTTSVFVFGPFPDSAYSLIGTYYQQIPSLNSSTTTNWLTSNAPHLLLAACLREAAKFIPSDEMLQRWEPQYQARLKALVDRDKAERWAAATMQVEVG